ncbi:MAG: glutathione S-transferase N-terminal domain-containing protein [Hyphomicrobiaceae bacterium]
MTIKLYDLTDASREVFFSPYCWRIRMALTHKGLGFKSIPWHFTDTELIAPSGQGRVPVVVDDDKWVHESFDIALYLDQQYPDRPPLMKDQAAVATAQFVEAWCATSVFGPLRPIAIPHVFGAIAEMDKAYFRESRETALKRRIEDLSSDPLAEQAALTASLRPAEALFAKSDYFGGTEPSYADYVLFGTLMWPYQVCPASPVEAGSATAAWFERMLDLFDGFARSSRRIHS